MDIASLVKSVSAAFEAFQTISDLAVDLGHSLSSQDQAALKLHLAELELRNDAARERRHAKLQAAAQQ